MAARQIVTIQFEGESRDATREAEKVRKALKGVDDQNDKLNKSFVNVGRSMGDTEKRSSKLGAALGKGLRGGALLAGAAVAAAGAGAVLAGKRMVSLASDAAEVDSKLKVTFGKTLPGITEEINRFAKATGASRYEMRQQVADMGALLKPMLGNEKAAAAMSVQMTELAADLGSFNNIPTAEALEKIRAGLVGEAEPLRSLGVLIDDATVKEEAYASGIAKRGEELTQVQKVQARANLILEQTTLAQGDATRTADSMANQLKRLRNSAIDAATDLGRLLIPAALKIVSGFNDAFAAVTNFVDRLRDAKNLQARVRIVWEGIRDLAKVIASGVQGAGRKIGRAIADGIEREGGWRTVGERIGRNIGDAITFSADTAKRLIGSLVAAINANRGPLAEAALLIAVTMVSKLTDPAFWAENWELMIGTALLAFGPTRVAKFAGGLIARLASALGGPAVRLGTRMGGWVMEGLANLPGRMGILFLRFFTSPAVNTIARSARGIGKSIYDNTIGQLTGLPRRFAQAFSLTVAVTAVRAALSETGDLGTAIWNRGKAMGARLKDAVVAGLSGMAAAVRKSFRDAINWIIDKLNSIKIPAVTILGRQVSPAIDPIPHIPRLARGGDVIQRGTAIVGEKGPELLTLERGARVTPLNRAGGLSVTIHLNGPFYGDENKLAYAIRRQLTEFYRQNGRLGFAGQ